MKLETPVSQLNRVGKVVGVRLKHLGILTVEDLLYYFPFRYEDYRLTRQIKDLQDGEQVTVKGTIEIIAAKRSSRARKLVTEAVVVDETDRLRVVWFGQPYIAKQLKVGDTVYLSGKIKNDMFGLQMTSPSYERFTPPQPSSDQVIRAGSLIRGGGSFSPTHTARLVPIYSLTAGLTQKQIRFLMKQIIDLADGLKEWISEEIREQAKIIPLSQAIRTIHFPETNEALQAALKRLKFDELFILQLRAEMVRQSVKRAHAPRILFQEDAMKSFVAALPFALTKAQKVAAWEILQDIERDVPMNRLLEGDVGSGKTVVAAMAMYQAEMNGFQSVIMAPTEVLAAQHFETLRNVFVNKEITIGLLSRSRVDIHSKSESKIIHHKSGAIQLSDKEKKGKREKSLSAQKKLLIERMKDGSIDIVIGTHALLTEDAMFKKLGLVVVDEQHRFGVEQRKSIREKSSDPEMSPHFLSMTATPIPRSFALTLYGDLDISIINELPAERKPIKTRVVSPHDRQKAYEFIRAQVKEGRQCFVICPLIETMDNRRETMDSQQVIVRQNDVFTVSNEKKAVLDEYEKLSKKIFPDLRVGYLHGKMKAGEKEAAMKRFANGEIDILVSTSVVEVGVNIPNASVMMIEGAERFGLAQLHQFRGRVGRSVHQSYCFLFTDAFGNAVKERLAFFEKTLNGFVLAEYDLQTRGPGEVYGTSQSGMMNFKLATMRDIELIKLARQMARDMDFEKYPLFRERVKEWERRVHLE